MSTINTENITVEEIEALPIGTRFVGVETGAHQWTVVEGGEAVTPGQRPVRVGLRHFHDALSGGLLRIEAADAEVQPVGHPVTVGQWRSFGHEPVTSAEGGRYYVLSSGDSEGLWRVLQVYADHSMLVSTLRDEDLRLTGVADRYEHVPAAHHRVLDAYRLGERLGRESTPTPPVNRRFEQFASALEDLLDNFDDADDRQRVIRLLAEHGHAIERNVTVRITVEVSQEVVPEFDSPDVTPLDVTAGTVEWSYEIETDWTYEGSEPDPCEDRDVFNESWAADWLNENLDLPVEVSHADVSFQSRSCSDC